MNLDKVASKTQAWLDQVEQDTDLTKFTERREVLFVSPHTVMSTPAGYYIGQVCNEYDWDLECWIPQPYSRNTGYMSKEDAERTLEKWEQEDPNSTMITTNVKRGYAFDEYK